MDLSEARGLVLFRVVREGIGISQRLSAINTCAPTGVSDAHPRTRASQEPTGHHQTKITGSIKGNVKENISPSTGSGETFLDFQPLSAMRGSRFCFFLCGPWGLALFRLSSFIFVSSDDADRFLKLASAAVVGCQPWIYLRLVA